jgi:hypothetical protein
LAEAAADIAKVKALDEDYGVLVLRGADGGYLLFVGHGPLETDYGQIRCEPSKSR